MRRTMHAEFAAQHPALCYALEDFEDHCDRHKRNNDGNEPQPRCAMDFVLAAAASVSLSGIVWSVIDRDWLEPLRKTFREREDQIQDFVADQMASDQVSGPTRHGSQPKKIWRFRGICPGAAWVKVAVTRRWIDTVKRRRPQPLPEGDGDPSLHGEPSQPLPYSEAARCADRINKAIDAALREMTDQQRRLLGLCYLTKDKISQRDAARMLGLGDGKDYQVTRDKQRSIEVLEKHMRPVCYEFGLDETTGHDLIIKCVRRHLEGDNP